MEIPELGNKDGIMSVMNNPGRASQRRYSPEEKAAAVRMVRALRKELGTKNGTVKRVADQLSVINYL